MEAADGEEALELYGRTSPDLVVLDLMLPKVSGLEVCRRLGADRRVPLIILTARGEEEDRIVGLQGPRKESGGYCTRRTERELNGGRT